MNMTMTRAAANVRERREAAGLTQRSLVVAAEVSLQTACTDPEQGNVACTSKGASSGEIKTKSLKGEVGFIDKETGEVGLRLAARKTVAKYQCGTTQMEQRGG